MLAVLVPVLCACLASACQHHAPLSASDRASQSPRLLLTFAQSDDKTSGLLNSFSGNYFRSYWAAPLITQHRIIQIERDYPLVEQEGWEIEALGVYCVLFTLQPGADAATQLQRLRQDERVESAQLLQLYQTRAATAYNDPYFSIQYGEARAYIQQLHQWSTGKGVDVAIIDTGVDIGHPDLQSQIFNTQVFVAGDSDDFRHDIHGTAMAGIIAASANNGTGIVGLAPDARLWVLKACHQLHSRSSVAQCDSFTLAKALNYAIVRNVDVLNLSLSGPYDPLIDRLIQRALNKDQIVVAADPGRGADRYPALIDGVLAAREAPPGQGMTSRMAEPMVVVTPQTELLSTGPGGGYDFFTGSSNAAALVSGLAAVLLQNSREWAPQVRVNWIQQALRMEQHWVSLNQPGVGDLAGYKDLRRP